MKSVFYCFSPHFLCIIKQIKKLKPCINYTVIKHDGDLRTRGKRRKHSPAARVFYISLVCLSVRRVISQCNTLLRLLFVLNNPLRLLESPHWIIKNTMFIIPVASLSS